MLVFAQQQSPDAVRTSQSGQTSRITVDYPAEGSIFPPEIGAPTFLWRDDANAARAWMIRVHFSDKSADIQVKSLGEGMKIGEIDPTASSDSNQPPQLTPEQAAAHTWTPDAETWAKIKRRSSGTPAVVTIEGCSDESCARTVSRGTTQIQTSRDPVGAPIFYRDVPLMPNQSDKGVIKPLAPEAVSLIKWRLRYVGEPKSHVVMEKLATCANCHSFSLDGKTLGLDVDGPQNDRGLYALVPVAKKTSIRTQDVIKWPTVRDPKIERLRASFMSQVSPDGRYVLTTVDDPEAAKREGGTTLEDKYYNANFMDYRFLQVFYPTRGVLAWYDRDSKRLTTLPGASDPKYVQTDGVWTPDGKYVVFARAEAKSPYPAGAKLALYANDPNETQIRYELYRMPFNDGNGGTPERIEGASANGMSNSFPKVSPDGKWIVFVKCRNGQLMRPDSRLWIVPFAGGKAREMKCNTRLMNSWHSFSPNGRWMVFSSKSRTPYTQLFLTHIDEDGNDSPAILLENATAANRAANLPEFVNIAAGGMENIETPAVDFYGVFNQAVAQMKKNKFDEAITMWRKAMEINPDDGKAHANLAYCLQQKGDFPGAITEFRKATSLAPEDSDGLAHFALLLAETGNLDESIANYRKSLASNANNPAVEADLGTVLFERGQTGESFAHLEKAVEMAPDFADGHNKLGSVLAKTGELQDALKELSRAVELAPDSVEYRFNLAWVLGESGNFAGAIPHLEKAVELSQGKDWRSLAALGSAYKQVGRSADATNAVRRALALASGENDSEAATALRGMLGKYEDAVGTHQ